MTDTDTLSADSVRVLGSDMPKIDPRTDCFGYAPFARRIAMAVRTTHGPQGLVVAILGPWGAGKSSLLNFIRHELQQDVEAVQSPVCISFNPWWFSSRDDLAKQFLQQFRAQLPEEDGAIRQLGNTLSEYSAALGTAVGVATGVPLIDIVVGGLLKLFRIKPKSIPEAKARVADGVRRTGRRFVFFIDDIDRLAPAEICEFFKVVKALADFSNVTYVLAFERAVVAQALTQELGVDGDVYLEKIVQAAFELPAVSKAKLRAEFFAKLNTVIEPDPVNPIDEVYWGNLYYEGLDQFIQKPRDIVRMVNALLVTYPAVHREVNPADFVALEFLRIFLPDTYAVIRNSRESFAGYSNPRMLPDQQTLRTFHDEYMQRIPVRYRNGVNQMLQRLFPRLEGIYGNMEYQADFLPQWRRELRVCSPDVFATYFQFGLGEEELSNTQLREFFALGADEGMLESAFVEFAGGERARPNGKANELVRRIRAEVGLSADVSRALIRVMMRVGDLFYVPADIGGGVAFRTGIEISWAVERLLANLDKGDRENVVVDAARAGRGVCTIAAVVNHIERHVLQGPSPGVNSLYTEFSAEVLPLLRTTALDKIERAALDSSLLSCPDLPDLIHCWRRWGNAVNLSQWMRETVAEDDGLCRLLAHYVQTGRSTVLGDRVSRISRSINPRVFQPELDTDALEIRVIAMMDAAERSEQELDVLRLYLAGMERLRLGQNPSEP